MRTSFQALTALAVLPFITQCMPEESASYTTPFISDINVQTTPAEVDQYSREAAFDALTDRVREKMQPHWCGVRPIERMKYVKYTNLNNARVFINFELGQIHFEAKESTHLRAVLIRTLLTPWNPENINLFTKSRLSAGAMPVLYGQVLDQDKKPVRWLSQAQRFADYLVRHQLKKMHSAKGGVYSIDIPLVPNHTLERQYQYVGIIRRTGYQYGIDESLLYAIIRTESNFNTLAISRANAYGLMQVIQHTAGKDVFSRIKNRLDMPTKEYLFKPQNNIDTGAAYLYLLGTHYLKGIEDPVSLQYAVVSAYNGGYGNVFQTFGGGKKHALSVINSMQPDEVYQTLVSKHPNWESRQYLEKVISAQRAFYQDREIL